MMSLRFLCCRRILGDFIVFLRPHIKDEMERCLYQLLRCFARRDPAELSLAKRIRVSVFRALLCVVVASCICLHTRSCRTSADMGVELPQ